MSRTAMNQQERDAMVLRLLNRSPATALDIRLALGMTHEVVYGVLARLEAKQAVSIWTRARQKGTIWHIA